MKRCELCKSTAKVYCDSDRASLCWSCDAKVHSANFLVARHSRSLLCQICQSPTPWSTSGKKLCPSTASICGRCVVEGISDDDNDGEERVGGNDEYDGDEYVDEVKSEVSADEIDDQAVPRCSTPPPPATSCSGSEEFSSTDGGVLLKRKRQNIADLTYEDNLDCSSANTNLLTPSYQMPEPATDEISSRSTSEATAGELKRIRQHKIISGDYISAPVDRTSQSTRTVDIDLNSSGSP